MKQDLLKASSLKTLIEHSGGSSALFTWRNTALIVIDSQKEYSVEGRLPLSQLPEASEAIATLLESARKHQAPIIHVFHRGSGGALFDSESFCYEALSGSEPKEGEIIVTKTSPNSFAQTDLQLKLQSVGAKNLLIVGYMTHMCVDSTSRAAFDLGYQVFIPAEATTTRDLADADGNCIKALDVKRATLAALRDRFVSVISLEALKKTLLNVTAVLLSVHAFAGAVQEKNRKVVRDFYDVAFNQHKPTEAAKKYIGSKYIQHNPHVPNGAEAFYSYFEGYYKKNPKAHIVIHRTLADGDLVAVHSHSKSSEMDLGRAVVDIFRVKNGKIVEHWDVAQSVPEKTANGNTMFEGTLAR